MDTNEEFNPWLRIPTTILWGITIPFGLLFSLYVALAFKSELVKNWQTFAMFMSSVIIFVIINILIWGREKMCLGIEAPHTHLILEAECTILLIISISGLGIEAMKPLAMVVNAVIALISFSFFVSLCFQKKMVV